MEKHFAQIADGIVGALDVEINEVESQMRGIVKEMEKGEANIAKRKSEMNECEEKIKGLSAELDELVFMLVEG